MLTPKVALLIVMLFGIIWLNNIEDTGENNKIEKFLIKHCELLKFAIVKITKNWYVVFSIILIIPSIFYTFSYAKDDLSRPFSNAKELADFINTRIEPGSVIIEGEPASVLYSAVNSYIENDVTIYNAIINRVENKMDYLKYDNETVGLFMDYEAKSKDELKKLFDELSEKYEHVYYYSSVLSCSSDPDLIELMENYDEIGKFNDKIYLDVAYARTAFYKIK